MAAGRVRQPDREHIYYCWQGEDATGISDSDLTNKRDCSAQRYLTKVQYGNQTPASDLYLWNSTTPSAKWLFTLVFDYGNAPWIRRPNRRLTPHQTGWRARIPSPVTNMGSKSAPTACAARY